MTIRYATPDDAAAIFDAHSNEPDNIPWRDADECREHILWMAALGSPPIVAETEAGVVAEMEVWWGDDVPELGRTLDVSMLEVHRDHQRRGIGTALMARAVELSREHGCDCVSVWADRRAIGFYERRGFEPRLVLQRYTVGVAPAGKPAFMPARLASLERPSGAHLQTWRLLHPKQKWHDLLWMEAEPPIWKGDTKPKAAVFAAVCGPAVAVYRLQHWLGDAETAELYLWSASRDTAVLTSAIDGARTLGVGALGVYAYGAVAEWMAELGAALEGEEQILARPNDREEP